MNLQYSNFLLFRKILNYSLLTFLFLLTIQTYSQQLAFPTATGAGAYTTGGRGYPVYLVTNLNDNGSGSMRQALADARAGGGGNIVFRVSGIIDLQANMRTGINNLTIYGQSAPAGGIALSSSTKGGTQGFGFWQVEGQFSDNIIMRYVKVRPHLLPYPNDCCDAFGMEYADNYIVDHCSFSFATDEAIAQGKGNYSTWTRNLIGESAKGIILGNLEGDYTDYSFNQNVFFNTSHRFPNLQMKGTNPRADIVNNLVWSSHSRLSRPRGTYAVNQINNYWAIDPLDDPATATRRWNHIQAGTYGYPTGVYSDGNYFHNGDNLILDGNTANDDYSALWFDGVTSTNLADQYEQNTPYALLGEPFTILTAQEVKTQLPNDVGANRIIDANGNAILDMDTLDSKYLGHIQNNEHTGWSHGELNTSAHHDSWMEDVGAIINAHPADYDTDNDGMPDAWETTTFGDLSKNGQEDTDGDGYTDLEEYMHLIDGEVTSIDATGVTVSPATATINIPETITLTKTFQPANATNQSGTWSSSNTAIATVNTSGVVTPLAEGEVIITFNSNSGGFSDSATITVTNIPISAESVSLSPETLDLNINVTGTIVATVLPANASNQTGVWSSSNPAIAAVDQQGLVQPIAVGQTTISFITNDGGFTDSSIVTINNDSFGNYEFYNADTDNLIQVVEGGEVFDLDNIGENVNFRVIPLGGDANPEVESVGIEWNGVENGTYGESSPLYAGMNGHIGNDYQSYTVIEGSYNFTITYYAGDSQSGDVVAVDNFELSFMRGSQVSAGQDREICLGDTAALAASGADSYLWSTGETSETIAVTPDVTSTYTVTGTHSDGSTTEDSVTVTVNELAIVDAGIDQSICEGDSVVLTATTSAGTLEWSNGATTPSITVSPNTTTTYTATANNNGCYTSDEVTVNVAALPIANAGNDVTLIIGESATLTASGGGEYLWNTGETTSVIVVSPTVDTTYTVIVSNVAGCASEDSVNVTVVEAIVANAGDDVDICEGESTTLTATGGDNYEWSTGETTQSISVSPTETTNYSVTVSNQSSSDTDSVVVTVLEQPIADVSTDVTINSGQSATLIAAGGDGYEWSTGETSNSITVTPATSTTYSVTVSNANGCSDTGTVTVTVIEPVVADAGDDVAICEGESIVLTATGGDSYLWSTGATTQSITVNPGNTTTYSVTVSNDNSSDSDSVLVTVNPVPVVDAGDDVTINQGENVTLYASGGNTYLWSTGDTNANISVSPTETTTYTVTTTINGCSDTDTVTVTVITLIQAFAGDDQTICLGGEAILTASGGDSYEWSNGETTESITVNPDSDTIYTVTVTNQYGSDSDEVSVMINGDCPEMDFEFRAFPNPTNGNLNVRISGLETAATIVVSDMLGNTLKQYDVQPNSQTTNMKINLKEMSKGMYLVTIYADNRTVTKKIVRK